MADDNLQPASPAEPAFVWHPEYQGKSVSAVRSSLATEITSDQRAYALTLDGAEEHEGDSLTSVIALERKWGPYDLNWAETDPGQLADRIVAFEQERERRQELIPYSAYRDQVNPADRVEYADPAAQRLDSPLVRGLVVLVLVVIVLVAWFLFFR